MLPHFTPKSPRSCYLEFLLDMTVQALKKHVLANSVYLLNGRRLLFKNHLAGLLQSLFFVIPLKFAAILTQLQGKDKHGFNEDNSGHTQKVFDFLTVYHETEIFQCIRNPSVHCKLRMLQSKLRDNFDAGSHLLAMQITTS